MRRAIVAAVVAGSAVTSACGQARSVDGGPTVSRSYQVGNFNEIEVAGPYNVGDKLVIRPEEQHGWFHFGWGSGGKATFTVTVPQLSGATIAGSGDINVDKVQGDRFEGTVAGSGGLGVGAMNVQSLKLAIAGSGDAKAGAGKAGSAEYEIAGSGGIDAGGIAVQDAKVSIAGSGSIKAHASGAADVSIMGSGDVDVTGGAKCSVHKAGSGDVRCS